MNTPPWLRFVLITAIVWLGVSVIRGINLALSGSGATQPTEVSVPRR